MRKSNVTRMILCAMFAAITAVLSQIVIPIGPVPINLATFAVFCAGALLGPKFGALSMTVWAALGAVGVPVFTMLRGGLGVLAGPTGGYIIGYIPAAFLIGLIVDKVNNNKMFIYPIAMTAGALAYFILGTAWFMASTNTELIQSLMICVIPFIPGEALKVAAATILAHRLRPVVNIRIAQSPKTKEI